MIILIAMVLIGVSLGSYLQLVSNQNISVMRSQAWNSAIAIAEAGIEEAMAHLNANTTNRTQDGWTVEGTNVVKERYLGTSRYKVAISKDLEPPVITSQAYVLVPLKTNYLAPRTVRVTTTNDALFAKGMVAKGAIDLSGNKIKTDSFDSTDPTKSTDGKYDPAKASDGGDIGTNSSVLDSLNVWNADIYGKASTGPGGNVKLGSNGAVGSMEWHAAGNNGIEPGWSSDDMNVYFPDVKRPWSASSVVFPPLPGIVSGTNYTYVLADGDYQMSELELENNEILYVTGEATLLVTSEIEIKGGGQILLAPGATLNLYMEGETTSVAGSGGLNNPGPAVNLSYWGLPTNTKVNMGGNAAFVGTLYAPQASLTLGGGGNNTYDFSGATVSNTVKMNGHFNFHYDEALGAFGPRRGYTIITWNESGWTEL